MSTRMLSQVDLKLLRGSIKDNLKQKTLKEFLVMNNLSEESEEIPKKEECDMRWRMTQMNKQEC
jgi:hypothetical protein